MKIETNILNTVTITIQQFKELKNPDQMLRTVANAVLPEYRKRIHVAGQASDGSPIGVYSPGYMKIRTGNYSNSKRVTRGQNKGKAKDAGVYTRGAKKGQQRPRYNRTNDTKVIFSLTRQMEQDESVTATSNGYGIGFKNSFNFKKSQYVEKLFKKAVWNLTAAEVKLANDTALAFVANALKDKK